MKENNFEDFLRKHREELDIEEPDAHLIWQGVRSKMGRRRFIHSRWVAAASVILLLGSLVYYWLPGENSVESNTSIADSTLNEELIFDDIDPDLAKEEKAILMEVKEMEEEVNLDKIDKQAYHDIFVELRLLEELHEEFKNDLPEFGEKEQLLNTLMKYYERKLKILERLDNEIEKKEQEKVRENEVSI